MYRQIHDVLLEDIRKEAYKQGEKLPSEKELSDRFQVSRITGKQALELLEEEGWIVRRQGAGSFVTDKAASGAPMQRTFGTGKESTPETAGKDPLSGKTIGVLFDNFYSDFGCVLVETIASECGRRGIHMYFRTTYGDIDRERAYINDFLNIGVQGMIVMCVHNDIYDDRILRLVIDSFPVILVDRDMANIDIPCVSTNNLAAAEQMTDRLLARGHGNVAFATSAGINSNTITDRMEGVERSLLKHGVVFERNRNLLDMENFEPTGDDALDETYAERDLEKVKAFMSTNPDIDAYFALQPLIGNTVLRAARELGRENEMDVAFFDGPKGMYYPRPYFGRVLQNEREMGRKAVELLEKRLAGESVPKTTYVPYRIETTEDPDE